MSDWYKSLITACSELRKVLFLTLSGTFFGCVWNVSGTTEWICTQFAWKTCLVPHSVEFEGQGQMSQSPRTKTGFLAGILGTAEWIYDRFTRKTCLVPHSDEFEGQGQFRWPVCGLWLEKHLCCSLNYFIMASLHSRCGHYIFAPWFLSIFLYS